jgi:hypothetical protein
VACNNCFASARAENNGALRYRHHEVVATLLAWRVSARFGGHICSSAEGAKDASDFRPFRAESKGRSNPALTRWAIGLPPLRGLAASLHRRPNPHGTASSPSRESCS